MKLPINQVADLVIDAKLPWIDEQNIFTSNVEDIDFSNIVQSEFLSNILEL